MNFDFFIANSECKYFFYNNTLEYNWSIIQDQMVFPLDHSRLEFEQSEVGGSLTVFPQMQKSKLQQNRAHLKLGRDIWKT